MPIKQKRNDTLWGNVPNIPDYLRKKYRSNATLGYVLDCERVVSLSQLRKKYSKSK